MQKEDKERVVAELTERLRTAETLIVADYRGLTMPQIDGLRGKLLEHGARLSVVKNTLTRRAAEAAGADALLAMLEGPTAIAFIESDGDPAAVAKALSDSARDTRILTIRGGVLNGRSITEADVENLAKLPPLDVLRGQVIGVILAPLTQLLGLVNAPLQNLIGLIDARIDQLKEQGDTGEPAAEPSAAEPAAAAEPQPEPQPEPGPAEEPAVEEPAAEAPTADAETEPAPEAAEETAEPEASAGAAADESDSEDEEA
jgi:large subunit ribosomal protein L10